MGIIVSVLFVGSIIAVVSLFEKLGWLTGENARKSIHILSAHWWFIAMYYFDKPFEAAVVPALFIVVNYLSFRGGYIKSMERDDDLKNLGTVYYAISLFVLAIWSFGIEKPEIGGMGILVMGYADGLAAVVGKKYGFKKWTFIREEKSVVGSTTAFVAAVAVIAAFNLYFSMGLKVYEVLVLGLVAACLEAITPLGFDNLTVPIGISVLAYLMI